MRLTDLDCRNAKGRDKPYKLSDGKGLYLEVTPSGSRLWRIKYRIDDREKRLALGVYPEVSLADARELRDEARKLLKEGIDPADRLSKRAARQARAAIRAEEAAGREAAEAERQRLLEQEKKAVEYAFEFIAREWWARQKGGKWTADHAARVIKRLDADVFPFVGQTQIGEITAPDMLAVLRRIEDRGALDLAGRIKEHVGAVFRYASATGRTRSYNPVIDLKGVLQTRKVKHRPALPESELPEFLRRLDAYTGEPQTRLGLRLLILTAVRTGELRFAKWEEFDFDGAVWRIPAERMKMRRPHLVPLARQALAALRELQTLNGGSEWLFPGVSGNKPISENTLLYAIYRMGYHGRATGHGFRAVFSTIMHERFHYKSDAIERALAHEEGNRVKAAYSRGEYLKDRESMLQDWADHLDTLAGGNVVPFRRAG